MQHAVGLWTAAGIVTAGVVVSLVVAVDIVTNEEEPEFNWNFLAAMWVVLALVAVILVI